LLVIVVVVVVVLTFFSFTAAGLNVMRDIRTEARDHAANVRSDEAVMREAGVRLAAEINKQTPHAPQDKEAQVQAAARLIDYSVRSNDRLRALEFDGKHAWCAHVINRLLAHCRSAGEPLFVIGNGKNFEGIRYKRSSPYAVLRDHLIGRFTVVVVDEVRCCLGRLLVGWVVAYLFYFFIFPVSFVQDLPVLSSRMEDVRYQAARVHLLAVLLDVRSR
jgi:hypothetical protein